MNKEGATGESKPYTYHRANFAETVDKNRAKSRRARLVVITCVVGLIVLIAGSVVLGVLLGQSKLRASGGAKNSTSGASSGPPSADTSVPDDASNFKADSRLHKAFYGMAYTPSGALPDYGCTSTLDHVVQDIQLLSQLTSRIRLYAADCDQSALVLEAIKRTKVDMQVYLGNFVVATDDSAYTRQKATIKAAIEKYGTKNIAGVTVGNEFMLNYVLDNNLKTPDDPGAAAGATLLKSKISDTRQMLSDMNLDKTIPVGTSDAGSYFNTEVLKSVDYALSNVHPWFANQTVQNGASWTRNFFDETNVQPAALLSNKPKMYIAETGWPTKSLDAGNANNGGSDASEANLQVFLNTFVCKANTDGVPYFFFEFLDEEWKEKKYGGVEGFWGLFDKNYNLKKLTLPTCISDAS
ncbi:glycoside hydrolase family 17 protein [Crepidotus variabilis]|uniref:glucan endo-1,3-beta-D-glucosidase n=1 Tax=Crepidotus variabilis TaxID=179855 RepID=A0A9P6EF44_9AGAR|nr:glycoside hydrolase family 17 protein [Crepidotus variabilis]